MEIRKRVYVTDQLENKASEIEAKSPGRKKN